MRENQSSSDEAIDEDNFEFTSYEILDDIIFEEKDEVAALLTSWKLDHLIPVLQNAEMDIYCLENMTNEHICLLNLNLKDRIYFETALKQWRTEKENKRHSVSKVVASSHRQEAPSVGKIHSEDVNLDNVLNTEKGQNFVCYQSNHGFDETARIYLVDAICEIFLVNKLHMKSPDFKRITEQIIAKFPEEEQLYYYVPPATDLEGKTTTPGGKLYHKFCNSKRKLTKHGLYPTVYRASKKTKTPEPSFEEPDLSKNETMIKLRDWLRLNHPNWEVLEQKWKESAKFREKDVKNSTSVSDICENWPQFRSKFGSYLINIDFEHLFPKIDSQKLLAGWEDFLATSVKYSKLHLKNQESKELATQIDNCASEDSRELISLYLLHAVLKPNVNIEYIDEGKKRIHRPGIVESRTSMVLHVKYAADVEKAVSDFHNAYMKLGLKVQPFVVAIGPAVTHVTEFLTIVDNLRFKFSNLRSAIDVCLKAVFVFSLEYQKESVKIWKLLENQFFFPLPKKKENVDILLLAKNFKTMEK